MAAPWLTLLGAVLAFGLDLHTKQLIIHRLEPGTTTRFGWLRLRRALNHAAPISRLRSRIAGIAGWIVAAISVLAVLWLDVFAVGGLAQFGLGCALGGAAGNLYDQFRRGGVVDFIDLRFWPLFNLADVAIVAGLTLGLPPLLRAVLRLSI